VRHLATTLSPHAHGLTPDREAFRRAESHPVPSMRDDRVPSRHPEREETAIVWAPDATSVAAVLTYHSRESWRRLRVLAA
jgi:hypothetical protein